jgi:hypothetical protein
MRCEDVQEFLDSRDLGETAQPPAGLDGHLKDCQECGEFAADLQFAAQTFAAVPAERFSEAKSQELQMKITQLEAARRAEIEEESPGFLSGIIDSLARLVAGPRLAYGLGMAAVMLALIAKLQSPNAPDSTEVAHVPPAAPITPIVTPVMPDVKKHQVELASGQVLLSGLLITGKAGTKIDLPENRSLSTIGGKSAVVKLDGATVAMGAATQIGVRERELRLASGQVGVHVQKGGQGFKTVGPQMTTFVMGTRYVAGTAGVELVEGKVEVSAGTEKSVLAPGQKATRGGKLAVQQIAKERMANLYKFFGNLDGREELAKDLGMTLAQLDAVIEPPVALPQVPASVPPTVPAARPASGPARGVPGELKLELPEPEDKPVEEAKE